MISSSLGIEAVVRALKAFPSSGEVQMNGLAAVQAITSDNEDRTLEGRRAKEIGVMYPIGYMYGIFTVPTFTIKKPTTCR